MVFEETALAEGEEMTNEQWEHYLHRWLEKHQRTGNRVPLAKLKRGWSLKVVDLVSNIKGMLGIADRTMEAIAQVFGVPISMLKGNAANFATARVDNYLFRVDTVEPEAYTIESVLTRHFRKYDPDVTVAHVPAIDEDPEQVRADEQHLLATGMATPAMLALRRGLPPIPVGKGGESYFIDSRLVPLSSHRNHSENSQ
jgi:hypothetical protein